MTASSRGPESERQDEAPRPAVHTARRLPVASRRLLQGMLALAVLVAIAIFVVTLRGAYQSVEQVSDKLITHATERTKAELRGFFTPVEQLLRAAEGWGSAEPFDLEAPETLNRLFMPVLRSTPVSSLLIARGDGAEYMLLEREDGWQNRLTRHAGGVSELLLWDQAGTNTRTWFESLDYDPRKRPWFAGTLGRQPSLIHFTEPYTFFTTKEPGITASLRFKPRGSALDTVVAFDLKLMDISQFTTSLVISERAQLMVMTDAGQVVGLPADARFRGALAIKGAVLKTPEELRLSPFLDQVRDFRGKPTELEPARYESGNETWWRGTESFALSSERRLWILVAIPEGDLTGQVSRQQNLILGILFVFLLALVVAMVLLERAMRRDVSEAVEQARTLGQYTLEQKLGTGGMGDVYRASHAMLRRPTAIKLLHRDKAKSETALSRFEREVQITAELTHPNTIAIYDYGHTPEGEFYYAMEYIEGVTLEQLIERTGPMQPARAIHVLRQVCGSLQEAHERGLIHRDIKPANVMLCERGGSYDVVKVLDFGLVKDQESSAPLTLTRANAITGTPLYMAPEAAMDPQSVDARSDLYAVGAVGFFLACGCPVFEGVGVVEILTQHMTAPPPRPRDLNPAVPGDLEDVILACLAKDREKRPASAAELAQLLAGCGAASEWTQATAKRWWEQHPALIATREYTSPDQSRTMTVAIPREAAGG